MLQDLEFALTKILVPIGIAIGSGYLIYIGSNLIQLGNSIAAMSCFFGSALFLSFIYLSKMKLIQGFGIRLETWEEKQKEAVEVIAKMREMAATFGRVASSELMTGMFLSGITTKQRFQFHAGLVEQLVNLQVSKNILKEISEEKRRIVSVLYFNHISKAAHDEDKGGRHIQMRIEIDANGWHVVPKPKDITISLQRNNQLHANAKVWIDDYDHFLKSGEIRRMEEFLQK